MQIQGGRAYRERNLGFAIIIIWSSYVEVDSGFICMSDSVADCAQGSELKPSRGL